MAFARWNTETKGVALTVFTGLTVSWLRHGLDTHWKSFASWEQFFLSAFVAGAILAGHRFFLGSEFKDSYDRLTFYIVMTVLVATLFVAFTVLNMPFLDFWKPERW